MTLVRLFDYHCNKCSGKSETSVRLQTEIGVRLQRNTQFINKLDRPKYSLLKIAIAHHRFVWIQPFNNGNGRTVHLFT